MVDVQASQYLALSVCLCAAYGDDYGGYKWAAYGNDYKDEEAVTEVVVLRVDAAANSIHVVARWVTNALVVDLDVTRVST